MSDLYILPTGSPAPRPDVSTWKICQREPTEAMCKAPQRIQHYDDPRLETPYIFDEHWYAAAWRAMFDAASVNGTAEQRDVAKLIARYASDIVADVRADAEWSVHVQLRNFAGELAALAERAK